MSLPPGQRAVAGFPRFGTHLDRPPPEVPADPALSIGGAVDEPFTMPLRDLAVLPRRQFTADFHCVAGWSATDLVWEGVAFTTFYQRVIEPVLVPDTTVTHVVFGGLDGYRVVVAIEDALRDDVLIAEHLNGAALDGDHGAPARLVTPSQYGFVNVKHLCRIEAHTSPPRDRFAGHPLAVAFLHLYQRHPRARVWEEERHRYLPAWAMRPFGRLLTRPLVRASTRR